MFRNIGRKIKTLAIILFVLNVLAFAALGVIAMISPEEAAKIVGADIHVSGIIVGIVIILGGILLSWLSTFLLYAFGELVESSTISAENSETIVEQNKKIIKALKALGAERD